MDTKMRRRDFLKISALAGVAVVAAACAPTSTPTTAPTVAPKATEVPKATAVPTTAPTAVPKATEVPKPTAVPTKTGFQGDIVFYAAGFTPTSENPNPDPKAPVHEAMKSLSKEWMDLHPGINFKFMQAPTGDYISWLNVQLIGGTGPDIFWHFLPNLNVDADEGKTIPLNDYFEMPNKYTPEVKTAWKNTFQDPFLTFISVKGNWGGVPMDLIATGIYANVDMFTSVGIDITKEIVPELSSPKDWATMISWCQKFKDAGFYGFAIILSILEHWPTSVLGDMLLRSWVAKYDLLNYHTELPDTFQKGLLNVEEICHAYFCQGLEPFDTPEMRDVFRVIKDWTTFMPQGITTPDAGAPMDLFLESKLAMLWAISSHLGTILQDSRRKFAFTSFWLPPLTKATSTFAQDPPILPIGGGGYSDAAYGINSTCIKKGNVEDCVDWLMFITTPEHDEMIVNEVPIGIPSNKKARSLPEIAGMFGSVARQVGSGAMQRPITYLYGWFGGWDAAKWPDLLKRESTLYYLGEQDADTFFANIKAGERLLAEETLRKGAIQYSKDGSWDLTRWKCQPTI